MRICVDCRKGAGGELEPYEFRLGERRLHVTRILERAHDAHHHSFTVEVTDGRRFVLVQDLESGSWQLERVIAAPAARARAS